ncbi:pantoate--beta-alanine ligase [Arthrobacter castelli]|uniref:pantoate--beta-alanine ligase n=1 Tax=Arthrobacter castelli TaxID=271431 RepID=UPI000479E25A|nr:pantoate--beta-alanine ligase [Arthrobacter castelli]
MEIFHSIAEYQRWREATVGWVGHVASLGYLHEGHRSLMRRARAENEHVVVTLYVNPLQFGPGEDFDTYPRDPAKDEFVCAQEDVSALLLLSDDEMYPQNFGTKVSPTVAMDRYEAASRPEHFAGVATVVTKLFNIVRPHRSYFGLKDYQQVQVVRRITEDLHLSVEVVGARTEREPDGLAMSSRNVRLSGAERSSAPLLYRALQEVQACLSSGERSVAEGLRRGRSVLDATKVPMTLEYFDAVAPITLDRVDELKDGAVVLAALRLPSARLIDNIVLEDEA